MPAEVPQGQRTPPPWGLRGLSNPAQKCAHTTSDLCALGLGLSPTITRQRPLFRFRIGAHSLSFEMGWRLRVARANCARACM